MLRTAIKVVVLFLVSTYLTISITDILKHNKEYTSWSGTGFFINQYGYLVTADHVVGNGNVFLVKYHSKYYTARLIGRDKRDDVAILKIEIIGNKYFNLYPTNSSEPMAVIGHPLGSSGIRMQNGAAEGHSTFVKVFFTTCAGNSGSPILNQQGEVKGVLTEGVGDFNTDRSCSGRGYGPGSSYVIRLAQSYKVPYTSFDSTVNLPFSTLYRDVVNNDTSVLILVTKGV